MLLAVFILKQHSAWLKPFGAQASLRPKLCWLLSNQTAGTGASAGEWGASFHPSTSQCLPQGSPITQAGCCVFLHGGDLTTGQEQGSLQWAPGNIFQFDFKSEVVAGWLFRARCLNCNFTWLNELLTPRLAWRRPWRIVSCHATDDLRPKISQQAWQQACDDLMRWISLILGIMLGFSPEQLNGGYLMNSRGMGSPCFEALIRAEQSVVFTWERDLGWWRWLCLKVPLPSEPSGRGDPICSAPSTEMHRGLIPVPGLEGETEILWSLQFSLRFVTLICQMRRILPLWVDEAKFFLDIWYCPKEDMLPLLPIWLCPIAP